MHTSLLRDPILCSSRPLFVESSQGASVMWPASSKRARRDVIPTTRGMPAPCLLLATPKPLGDRPSTRAIQKSFAREGEGDLEITHHIAIEVDTKHAVECSFFC